MTFAAFLSCHSWQRRYAAPPATLPGRLTRSTGRPSRPGRLPSVPARWRTRRSCRLSRSVAYSIATLPLISRRWAGVDVTVTLESLGATLDALKADNQREHDRIMAQLMAMNGKVNGHSDDITRLKEQSNTRSGALGVFTVIASVVAGWLGMRT